MTFAVTLDEQYFLRVTYSVLHARLYVNASPKTALYPSRRIHFLHPWHVKIVKDWIIVYCLKFIYDYYFFYVNRAVVLDL